MDIDALASEFGSAGVAPAASASAGEIEKKHGITIRPVAPPISGDTAPLPQPEVTQAGGANPRDTALAEGIGNYLPSIGHAIADQAVAGGKNFSGGLGDVVNQGQLGAGAKRMGIGTLQALTSIPSGVASEGVGKPLTQITGNPDFGDKAAFLAGSAIPILPGSGLVVGKPMSSIVGAINNANPNKVALKDLIENITNAGANPENLVHVVQNMKANPRLGPADLNPAVLSAAQKVFTQEGDTAKNYLAQTSANRMATTKDTINNAANSTMGIAVNAAQKVDELKAAARAAGKEEIEPFLAANPHTDVTALIKHIDSEIGHPAMKAIKEGKAPPIPLTPYQSELLTVRNKLRNVDWPDRERMFAYTDQMHEAQSKLREKAQGLVRGSVGSEQNLGKDLFAFREKMKDAVGPEYKAKLGKYADEKKIGEAFHYGYDNILNNSTSLEHDPSFFEKWVKDPNKKEGELNAAKEGARLRFNTAINGTRSAATNPASKAIGIGQVEFNRQRLTTLLGKEEADKLFTALDHARLEANTHNKLIEGSQTANRIAADSKRTIPEKTPESSGAEKLTRLASWVAPEAANFYGTGYAIPGIGLAVSMAANAGHKYATAAKDSIKIALAKENNAQYAKLALPTEGPSRDALIKSLEAAIPGPNQSILRRLGNSRLSRLVAP